MLSNSSRSAGVWFLITLAIGVGSKPLFATEREPLGIIFDTDIGNDIDDALALGVIHALESRGECRLLAVTISKDNPYCAPFIDLINTFYGRGDIPIGMVRHGKTPEDSRFTRETVLAHEGNRPLWPHDLKNSEQCAEAVMLLRHTLAEQPDQSVALIVVGFSTNIARLLESSGDESSQLSGRELCQKKCRVLSMMAGMFSPEPHKEYNVYVDLPAADKVFKKWPGALVVSGYEIGSAIKFPATSIKQDFNYVRHHPLKFAYELYQPMPYDRETWDLTSVLYAVRPNHNYFDLSEPGLITIGDQSITHFEPQADGRHCFLKISPEQATRTREALIQLASQPALACKPYGD